jgi:hypothetical protein
MAIDAAAPPRRGGLRWTAPGHRCRRDRVTSDDAPAAPHRTLGIALQILAVLELQPLLVSGVRTMFTVPEDIRGEYLAIIGPVLLAALAQLAAGCALTYARRRWAITAVCAYAAITVGATIWLAIRMSLDGTALVALFARLIWPVAVAASAIGASAAPRERGRRSAEVGGVLAALGLASLLSGALVGLDLIRYAGAMGLGAGVFEVARIAIDVLLGLLALRAGGRLVTGADRSGLGAYLVAASVLPSALIVIQVIAALSLGFGTSVAGEVIVGAVWIAGALLLPLLLGTYARPGRALAARGAPDYAAAVGAPAWIVLWYAIELGAGTLAVSSETSGAELIGLLIVAPEIVLVFVAFFACSRGLARAAMWTSAIAGGLMLVVIGVLWLVSGDVTGSRAASLGNPARLAALLLVLAWLHRPSARDQRTVEDVFD